MKLYHEGMWYSVKCITMVTGQGMVMQTYVIRRLDCLVSQQFYAAFMVCRRPTWGAVFMGCSPWIEAAKGSRALANRHHCHAPRLFHLSSGDLSLPGLLASPAPSTISVLISFCYQLLISPHNLVTVWDLPAYDLFTVTSIYPHTDETLTAYMNSLPSKSVSKNKNRAALSCLGVVRDEGTDKQHF